MRPAYLCEVTLPVTYTCRETSFDVMLTVLKSFIAAIPLKFASVVWLTCLIFALGWEKGEWIIDIDVLDKFYVWY